MLTYANVQVLIYQNSVKLKVVEFISVIFEKATYIPNFIF